MAKIGMEGKITIVLTLQEAKELHSYLSGARKALPLKSGFPHVGHEVAVGIVNGIREHFHWLYETSMER